ncbi:MAG TPA: MFS transporter [Azospirillum sp.]|nr:MFS transporter [Azospirillum sp.]
MPDIADAVEQSRFRSAFRHRSYALFWSARLSAWLAGQMQAVAVGWQMYELTSDPLDLGLVGLFQFLPQLLLTLVAGHVVDSRDRRRILLAALLLETVGMTALLVLTAAGAAAPAPIFAVVFLLGVAKAFAGPAHSALIAAVVPTEDLPNAVAWNSSAIQVSTIGGPALGGLLYIAGPAVVYGVGTALLTIATIFVLALRPRPVEPAPRGVGWGSMLAGFSFIRSRRDILGAISLDMVAVLLGGATALLPVYARDILDVGPWGLGLLRSAPALGALTTAMVLARWSVNRRAGWHLLVAVMTFGAATVAFGLSTEPVLSGVALFALGAADEVSVFVRQTLIQLSTPDQMRGRVGAVSGLFIGASNQLGAFESGATAALFGTVPAVVAGGVGAVLIALVWAWRFPELRRIDRLLATR